MPPRPVRDWSSPALPPGAAVGAAGGTGAGCGRGGTAACRTQGVVPALGSSHRGAAPLRGVCWRSMQPRRCCWRCCWRCCCGDIDSPTPSLCPGPPAPSAMEGSMSCGSTHRGGQGCTRRSAHACGGSGATLEAFTAGHTTPTDAHAHTQSGRQLSTPAATPAHCPLSTVNCPLPTASSCTEWCCGGSPACMQWECRRTT